MDVALFSSLLRNLLQINVMSAQKGENEVFRRFQDRFCYRPALQPAFTAAALVQLADQARERTFYGLQDDLGVCLIFFRFEERVFLLGPFVRTAFDQEKVQRVLLACRLPVSYASSIRLYCSAFPILSSTHVRSTALSCIRSFSQGIEDYAYCRLKGAAEDMPPVRSPREESLDYSAIHSRYDVENAFLRLVEAGDTENVLTAHRRMNMADLRQNRYLNAIYTDPGVGFSMLRAMVRKAAERGGASLVEIHEITQRAVQRIAAAGSLAEQMRYSDAMILELTEAVRRSRLTLGRYSEPIRKVMEHIQLNYSQALTLEALSRVASLSPSYLTKAFKKETGMTLFQYIAQLRCRQAARMLRDSRASIQDISGYVGYEDNNYFVKVFRRQYGVTPSEYRRDKAPC